MFTVNLKHELHKVALAVKASGIAWQALAKNIAGEGLEVMQRVAQKEAPVGVTSNLRNSISVTPIGLEGTAATHIYRGAVVSDVIHAGPVEDGRQAGRWPPVDALIRWVQVKLQVAQERARGVAFLVARKIGTKGTKGWKMFQKAADHGRRVLPEIARRRVGDWTRGFGR